MELCRQPDQMIRNDIKVTFYSQKLKITAGFWKNGRFWFFGHFTKIKFFGFFTNFFWHTWLKILFRIPCLWFRVLLTKSDYLIFFLNSRDFYEILLKILKIIYNLNSKEHMLYKNFSNIWRNQKIPTFTKELRPIIVPAPIIQKVKVIFC